jgi:hypothetical protein
MGGRRQGVLQDVQDVQTQASTPLSRSEDQNANKEANRDSVISSREGISSGLLFRMQRITPLA